MLTKYRECIYIRKYSKIYKAKMVKFKWKFIKKINLDKSEFKDWYTNDLGAVVTKSDLISCTCCNEKNSHKMRCYRLDCNSTECNVDELC